MTKAQMSTRVRFNRVQKELAQAGIAFLAITGTCRCCLSLDTFKARNKHIEDMTEETPYIYNSHGMESEFAYNRAGDIQEKNYFSIYRDFFKPESISLGHGNMTPELWGTASGIFSKYDFSLDVPEDASKVGTLNI